MKPNTITQLKDLKKWLIIGGIGVVAFLGLMFLGEQAGFVTDSSSQQHTSSMQVNASVEDDSASSTKNIPKRSSEPSSAISSKESSDNMLLNLNIVTADVMNGSGDAVLGQRAYITIDKSTMKSLTEKDFNEFVEKAVVGSGYNYFSISFNDGTGIQFPGSMKEIILYGNITDDGVVLEELGYVKYETDGTYSYSDSQVSSSAIVIPSQEKTNTTDTTSKASTDKPTSSSPAVESESKPEAVLPAPNENTVYWGESGTKYHRDSDCRSFKGNTPLSGTIAEAQAAGRTGWCGICSK